MVATTTGQESLDVVRRSQQAVFNERQYDEVTEYQSEDVVLHGPLPGQVLRGTEATLESMKTFHDAFSDLESTEEVAFSDGEYVCTSYTYRGTHDGDLMGLAATDVEAEVPGITINRVEDGKIVEGWVVVDFLSLLQQVGAVPPLEELSS